MDRRESVASCTAFDSTLHLSEWLMHHKRVGIALVFAHAQTTSVAVALQPFTARREVILLRGALAFTEPLLMTLVQHPIVRRWGGQLEFLHQCFFEAQRHPDLRWLINIDSDEFVMASSPGLGLSAALRPFSSRENCLLVRRHNFFVQPGTSLLTSARWRAPFPPQPPPKGVRRHHGLSQPLHPKWLINLLRTRDRGAAATLILNQHAIFDATSCVACAQQATRAAAEQLRASAADSQASNRVRPFPDAMRTVASWNVTSTTDQRLLFELAALAPFSQAFDVEFNDMLYLDGNASNACQFPHKCSLASAEHPGIFSRLPPPKQRLLSCFSTTASGLLTAQTKLQRRQAPSRWVPPEERCWRAACLSGESAEAAIRIHHCECACTQPESILSPSRYAYMHPPSLLRLPLYLANYPPLWNS